MSCWFVSLNGKEERRKPEELHKVSSSAKREKGWATTLARGKKEKRDVLFICFEI